MLPPVRSLLVVFESNDMRPFSFLGSSVNRH